MKSLPKATTHPKLDQTKAVLTGKYGMALCFSLLLLFYHIILRNFFPNSSGGIGNDYEFFLPRILDNFIWIEHNGFFSIRWFTPSFCGGLPSFGNPQDMYFTLPQLFSLVFPPLKSVYLTIVLFALLGLLSMFYLLRSVFGTSTSVSLLGGILFMLNGCYLFRMVIGHLTFHSFMLIPGIAALLFSKE
jgi:hypothetical protein